jgi:hypothetical protein
MTRRNGASSLMRARRRELDLRLVIFPRSKTCRSPESLPPLREGSLCKHSERPQILVAMTGHIEEPSIGIVPHHRAATPGPNNFFVREVMVLA